MYANPVLIGAVTVLVAIVAVFLAYNANNGLPFVPRYTLHVQVRDATELTHGAEVHETGGRLIGYVTDINPARDASGFPLASLTLELNKSVQPLPVDSTFAIRLKGTIGLKYLQVTPGHSSRGFVDGATVPSNQTSASVDLDQVLDMYDAPTRKGTVASTVGFGSGLAGRGGDLNDAIHEFVPLVTDLGPVMRNLSSKHTDLGGFFRGLESFSHAVAPVASTQANLYVNLDTTFRSLASVARPYLQDWIHQTPPTFQTVIARSPTIEPFVTDTADLFKKLRPGFATLPQSAPVLASAEAIGTRNLPGTSGLDQRLVGLSKKLRSYGETPAVQQGLDRITQTFTSLHPLLSFLTPVQTSCNYVTLFLRNSASLVSDHVGTGTTFRFLLVAIDQVLGDEAVPAQHLYTTPDTSTTDEHGAVHVNPYPNTASPGQTRECSAGNEPFSASAGAVGNPPGNVGVKTETTTAGK
jgi:ABC-type transporter Mla subunit MlaD